MILFNKKAKIEDWGNKKKVDKLVKELSNRKSDVRMAVVKALGAARDYRAVTALISALTDQDINVRLCVVDILGNIGDPRAKEHLRYISEKDANEELRKRALAALAKIAGKDL